jgi:hypothetical protein
VDKEWTGVGYGGYGWLWWDVWVVKMAGSTGSMAGLKAWTVTNAGGSRRYFGYFNGLVWTYNNLYGLSWRARGRDIDQMGGDGANDVDV